MTDARVAAALLATGRSLHAAALAMTVVAALSGTPAALAAIALLVVETLLAVRVGLDARLFDALADGLEPSELDRALVRVGLVRDAADRPLSARIAGALRLWRAQIAAAALVGACAAVAVALRSLG